MIKKAKTIFQNILSFLGVFLSVNFIIGITSASATLLQEVVKESDLGKHNVNAATLGQRIGGIVEIIFGFLGVILLVIIIYAGFLWTTAGGNEEQVKKAKNILRNSVIGLVIVLMAYVITGRVLTAFYEAT